MAKSAFANIQGKSTESKAVSTRLYLWVHLFRPVVWFIVVATALYLAFLCGKRAGTGNSVAKVFLDAYEEQIGSEYYDQGFRKGLEFKIKERL